MPRVRLRPDARAGQTALFVWVLQLVDDPDLSLREASRVVRPGGRVVALFARADDHPDDEIAQVLSGLAPVRRRGHGADPDLVDAPDGLELLHRGHTPWDEFPDTAAGQIAQIEGRQYSSLFDLDDETWTRVVVPVLDELPRVSCTRPHPDATQSAPDRRVDRRRALTQVSTGAQVASARMSGLLRSNVVVAGGTALSRVTGLLRLVVLGYVLGQTALSDAYLIANETPNVVYELLLGGVLSARSCHCSPRSSRTRTTSPRTSS